MKLDKTRSKCTRKLCASSVSRVNTRAPLQVDYDDVDAHSQLCVAALPQIRRRRRHPERERRLAAQRAESSAAGDTSTTAAGVQSWRTQELPLVPIPLLHPIRSGESVCVAMLSCMNKDISTGWSIWSHSQTWVVLTWILSVPLSAQFCLG